MNRILHTDKNTFHVLLSPSFTIHTSMENMLNNWSDPKLRSYKIVELNTMQDAMDLAYRLPPIDWNKLVESHIDAFEIISNSVKNTLGNGSFIVEIDSHLMNPTELKETMFKRIKYHGERFNLFYNANDLICINIINPWTRNLIEIVNTLKTIPELNVKKIIRTPTHIKMIGLTDIGTTYEIRLWTTHLAQWARWIQKNELNPADYINLLKQYQDEQNRIDKNDLIR
jgi:hypothetical protein